MKNEMRREEGRRRGKLTKFRSRGRGRREEEDGVLGFSWDAFNPHLQRGRMKKEEEEEVPAVE